jgi:hypothetical protein
MKTQTLAGWRLQMGKYMHRIRCYWPIGKKTESKCLWEREVGEFDVFNGRTPITTKQLAKNEEHCN